MAFAYAVFAQFLSLEVAERTRNVQGCNVAKSKTQQMCRSQGINGQLVELEQSHGSSLEPLDKHFQSHGLIYETRKVSKLENKICHDLNPRRSMDDLCDPTTHADCEEIGHPVPPSEPPPYSTDRGGGGM